MPNDDEKHQFPDEIQAAFESYPKVQTSPEFEAHFWQQLDARRSRYRGVLGLLRRLWELEIEGVAVWRLALSTLSGGAVCALLLGVFIGFSRPQNASLLPLPPLPNQIPTAATSAYAFLNRDWENDVIAQPKPEVTRPKAHKKGGDFSWNGSKTGSNTHLA